MPRRLPHVRPAKRSFASLCLRFSNYPLTKLPIYPISLNSYGLCCPFSHGNPGKPSMPVCQRAIHDSEELALQGQGNGSRDSVVDVNFINGANGRDFRSCAAEEDFI